METKNPNLAPGFVHGKCAVDIPAHIKLVDFPGGFRCFTHTSIEETEFIYNEVFVQQEYLRHGLALEEAACIIDAGANIGMFTLFAKKRNPRAVVYAFEPIRETCNVLKLNVELHRLEDVHVQQAALGARPARRVFTYYPHMAGNSTARPSMKNTQLQILERELGKDLVNRLFHSERRSAPVRTLADFLDKEGIPVVDFLKIDVEGDELAVLKGMDGSVPEILNLALETHTPQITREACGMLKGMGYEVFCETGLSSFPDIANVYAVRR